MDLAEAKEKLSMLRRQKELVLRRQRKWEQQLAETTRTGRLMRVRRHSMEADRREYGYVKELENMAVGNNAKRIVFEQYVLAGYFEEILRVVFEQYVLAGYFEEILRAANLRFNKMTSGRYEMSRVNEVGDGRIKDNLEIQVLDNYTGRYRSVRTLSGGETFKASLCLALGMSDVIQSMNGGVRVDTLFVDEGFGALDDESLEQACSALTGLAGKNCLIGIISHVPQLRVRVDTLFVDEGFGALDDESLEQACSALTGLAGKNCLIGIISHVPQLRERIGAQLVIEKTGSGSLIRNGI